MFQDFEDKYPNLANIVEMTLFYLCGLVLVFGVSTIVGLIIIQFCGVS